MSKNASPVHKPRLLLLCNRPSNGTNAQTIVDHLDAIHNLAEFNVTEVSTVKILPELLNLNWFDVIVIHYTLQLGEPHDHFLSPSARRKIGDSNALKVAFIQDEYRDVAKVQRALIHLDVRLLFTLLTPADCATVYPASVIPNLRTVQVLAGYVPTKLVSRPRVPIANRAIDVAYRARKMPIWLGTLSFEKWQIATRFVALVSGRGLRLDISSKESDRFYSDDWIVFLENTKCVLGTESGSNVLDLDGTLRSNVESFQANHPDATLEAIYDKFVSKFDGLLSMNQISPRHFEACALGTVQILFSGSYSGILTPDIHYIELKKDFSNLEDVMKKICDTNFLQNMADRAFKEIANEYMWSFAAFSDTVNSAILQSLATKNDSVAKSISVSNMHINLVLLLSLRYAASSLTARFLNLFLKIDIVRNNLFRVWFDLHPSTQQFLRPFLKLLGR